MRIIAIAATATSGVATASEASPSGESSDPMVILLIGLFTLGVIVFAFLASKFMKSGSGEYRDDEAYPFPIGIGDDGDERD